MINCRNFKTCKNTLDKGEYEIAVSYQVNFSKTNPKWSNDKPMTRFQNLCLECLNKVQSNINEAIKKMFE